MVGELLLVGRVVLDVRRSGLGSGWRRRRVQYCWYSRTFVSANAVFCAAIFASAAAPVSASEPQTPSRSACAVRSSRSAVVLASIRRPSRTQTNASPSVARSSVSHRSPASSTIDTSPRPRTVTTPFFALPRVDRERTGAVADAARVRGAAVGQRDAPTREDRDLAAVDEAGVERRRVLLRDGDRACGGDRHLAAAVGADLTHRQRRRRVEVDPAERRDRPQRRALADQGPAADVEEVLAAEVGGGRRADVAVEAVGAGGALDLDDGLAQDGHLGPHLRVEEVLAGQRVVGAERQVRRLRADVAVDAAVDVAAHRLAPGQRDRGVDLGAASGSAAC